MCIPKSAFGAGLCCNPEKCLWWLDRHHFGQATRLVGGVDAQAPFPTDSLYQALGDQRPQLNDAEIERVLSYGYQGRYTYLVLTLMP